MDKLRAIKFFCRAAEAKSFATAAQSLDVVPSVFSKTIASLERDIDFRLFNRTTRRVSLTEDGARYYERCKRLLVELEDVELLTRKGKDRPVGRLAIGIHPAFHFMLMSRINEFLKEYPDISVETTTSSLVSTLIDDRLDVLITIGDLPNSNFGVQTIARSQFVLVATPAYLRTNGTPRVPADLTSHAVIVSARRDNPSFVQWTLRRETATETVFAPARIVSREGVHMREACLSGAGICRQVKFVVDPFLAAGDLEQVLPEWSLESFPVQAVYPNRKEIPAKVSALIGFFRAMLREKQWWLRGETTVIPMRSTNTRRRSGKLSKRTAHC